MQEASGYREGALTACESHSRGRIKGSTRKLRVAVITNLIVNYRKDFWRRIFGNRSVEVTVFCQEKIPGMNLQSINRQFPDNVTEVPFWALRYERICWQRLPVRRLWKDYDIYIFMGNPRIVSTLIWATMFRFLGHPVVIWGQGHSAGSINIFEKIRLLWWRLFDYFFVYTDEEVRELLGKGFRGKIVVAMNNGLDQRSIEEAKLVWEGQAQFGWKVNQELTGKIVLLSCSRLEKKTQLDLVIRALPDLKSKYQNIIWCVIGDGIMKDAWQNLANKLGVSSNIRWVGALNEELELAPWFMAADIYVHPGAIGLSIMHAFGYGLPVVTHDNPRHHGPEVTALEEGKNGSLFPEGDVEEFSKAVETLIEEHDTRYQMGLKALSCARYKFNTSVMATRFFDLLKRVQNRYSGVP